MTAPAPSPAPLSSRKRSWRRYSLGALFFVILAAGILFGWLAYRIREFHDQVAFIDDLRSRGFRIDVEPVVNEWFWRPLVGDAAVQVKVAYLVFRDDVRKRMVGPTDEDMRRMRTWTAVKSLGLFGPAVTDETFQIVSRFRELWSLGLDHTLITDAATPGLRKLSMLQSLYIVNSPMPAGFADVASRHDLSADIVRDIATLPKLFILQLDDIPMTDESVRLLVENRPHLTELHLRRTGLTNHALSQLGRLYDLNKLVLDENPAVNDKGLEFLTSLKPTTVIQVRDTGVTREGMRSIAVKMPN